MFQEFIHESSLPHCTVITGTVSRKCQSELVLFSVTIINFKCKLESSKLLNLTLTIFIHRVRKNGTTLFLPLILRNANRFSKFFHWQT